MPSENVTFTIYGPLELKAALEARAKKEGRSSSAVAVRVLEAAAKRWQANAATGVQPGSGTPSERVSLNGTSNRTPRVNGRSD